MDQNLGAIKTQQPTRITSTAVSNAIYTSSGNPKDKKYRQDSTKPTKLALFGAALRFFVAISLCLGLSLLFDNPRLGGFACLACFMILLSDTNSSLKGRIGGAVIVLAAVGLAVLLGFLSKQITDGRWLVIIIACFGTSLLPFIENFWWLVSKYFLIFLMTFLFEFTPDLSALEGYLLGFLVSVIVITIDHFMWKVSRLGKRPMDEIKRFIGGVRNSKSFAIISTLVLFVALWTALEMKVKDPAWVGVTVIYLMNTKISTGITKSIERIVGNALAYALVVLIFAIPDVTRLYILGPIIVFVGALIPVFFTENYLLSQTCTTTYILLVLEWLSNSYGGDSSLLGWRLVDTIWGATCVMGGFMIMAFVAYIEKKIDERRYRKVEKEAEELELLEEQQA